MILSHRDPDGKRRRAAPALTVEQRDLLGRDAAAVRQPPEIHPRLHPMALVVSPIPGEGAPLELPFEKRPHRPAEDVVDDEGYRSGVRTGNPELDRGVAGIGCGGKHERSRRGAFLAAVLNGGDPGGVMDEDVWTAHGKGGRANVEIICDKVRGHGEENHGVPRGRDVRIRRAVIGLGAVARDAEPGRRSEDAVPDECIRTDPRRILEDRLAGVGVTRDQIAGGGKEGDEPAVGSDLRVAGDEPSTPPHAGCHRSPPHRCC
jgi:hypothetical protein